MKKVSLLVFLGAVIWALAPGAFADSQIIDFSCLLEGAYNLSCADCPYRDIQDIDYTRQGGLGIRDAEEFKLLSFILADPAAPRHDEIHSAFAANATLARTAVGSTILWLTTPTDTSGPRTRQPIPNTDPQLYYGADGLLGAYITFGEWDLYMETMEGFSDSPFGSQVVVPTSDEGYVILQDLMMCSDVDGDGVSNCYEYWAASPYSFAGAVDLEVTDAACAWNVWACSAAPADNVQFVYNASTQRVYFMPADEMTWAEARNFTPITYPGRTPISVSLCTIRNSQENDFLDSLFKGNRIWIGCTDAGRDIGHTAPNPQDWYWLSDPSQSLMSFTNWKSGEPNGVDGAEDCGVMQASYYDGWGSIVPCEWIDVSEFTGSPPEPRLYPAVFELPGTYPDADSNGAPDAFEDKDGDLLPDGLAEGEGEGEEPGEGEGEETPLGCFGNVNLQKTAGGSNASLGSGLVIVVGLAMALAGAKRRGGSRFE